MSNRVLRKHAEQSDIMYVVVDDVTIGMVAKTVHAKWGFLSYDARIWSETPKATTPQDAAKRLCYLIEQANFKAART